MKKLLSILIPFYNETIEEVFPNVQMINSQVGIDFDDIEVVFVNDGNDNKKIEEFVNTLPLKFDYRFIYMKENLGPGVARQTGIDESVGKYVMFCDADDSLHNIGVLQVFLLEINSEKRPDIITTKWQEELVDKEGNYIYITHSYDFTWMHGNVYKKSFLDEFEIRFHPELRIHEDSYFQSIAAERTNNKSALDAITYIWRYRPTSIVRRNGAEYSFSGNAVFYDAIGKSFDEIVKFKPDALFYKVTQLMMYGYFSFLNPKWHEPENKKFYNESIESYKDVISKYINFYIKHDKTEIAKIYKNEFNREELRDVPPFSPNEFLKGLGIIKYEAPVVEEEE